MDYYEPRLPCDATQIGRFRRAVGEEGLEQLLKATINTAVEMKAIKPTELERVIVDTTVQEKAIAHPVDSRLLEIARHKIVSAAKQMNISLKQTFAAKCKELMRKAGGYTHAKQYKRLKKTVKRQRTILGVVMREVQRKLDVLAATAAATTMTIAAGAAASAPNTSPPKATALGALKTWLERAERIRTQQRHDKNKLYALHAPEVECIGKGKARKPYEFGTRAGQSGGRTARAELHGGLQHPLAAAGHHGEGRQRREGVFLGPVQAELVGPNWRKRAVQRSQIRRALIGGRVAPFGRDENRALGAARISARGLK
jgi:transposase, IS5 family